MERLAQLKGCLSRREALTYLHSGTEAGDTPADISIALGGLDKASPDRPWDVVILEEKPAKVISAVACAKLAEKTILQTFLLVLLVKLALIVLGLIGFGTIWFAALADSLVCLLAVFHSMYTFHMIAYNKDRPFFKK